MGDNIGHRRSAQPRRSHEICFRTRALFAEEVQQNLGVRLADQRGPANQNGFFHHRVPKTPFDIGDALIMLWHCRIETAFQKTL
jgi:hypothetical protein